MLCSPIELGLGEDASGLLILSPDAKIGAPIGDLLPADTILDVEITPNRGDLLSHFGLAREIAALTRKKLESAPREAKIDIKKSGVTIGAIRECPFFSARKIDNVAIGPSPQWLRAKIESVGIRSINNIVDISNFVMLELGQPTHAFDADKLKGRINVRLARDGEKFLALDGKIYSLKPDNLVVADQERAVGIAGVMGGEETGVTESTKNILLESAYFLPATVRRTARNLNLPSDASYRFERGVDPQMVLRASQRATELFREIAGGTPAIEVEAAGKVPANPADVSLSYEKCDRVVGIAIKPKTVDEILEGFGLQKIKSERRRKNGSFQWKIPSYRRDLQRDVDLIEEIVRVYGVDKIAGTDRTRFSPSSAADNAYDIEQKIRERLVAIGFNEIRTSVLIPSRYEGFENVMVKIRNPLDEFHVFLRPGLLPGLVRALELALRRGERSIQLFELGNIFKPPDALERRHLGILICGAANPQQTWQFLKGSLEILEIPNLSVRQIHHSDFNLAVALKAGQEDIGVAGHLNSQWMAEADAKTAVFMAEINVRAITKGAVKFQELERFPAITRDIALIVPEKISHAEILRVIQEPREPLLESVELFDLFTEQVGAARKSLAYRLTYRDRSRTLTSEEVTAAHARIRERLQRELGAELRE
jgi:phenylalanyl-tRNA synthetase beta chain